MPTSNLAIAQAVLWLVHSHDPHDSVLDVGPGWGKYATLLREYLNEPPTRIDAVEAWVPYIEEHRLAALYDDVIGGDVCDLAASSFAAYDVVLMVDVIEHIGKTAALDLLDRIPGAVVISTPVEFFDTGPGLPPTEQHVSHWSRADFASTGRLDQYDEIVGGQIVRLAAKR